MLIHADRHASTRSHALPRDPPALPCHAPASSRSLTDEWHGGCLFRKHVDFVKLLLEWGADLTVQDVNGTVPKGIAEKKGFTEIVELLEAHAKK